MARPSRRAGNLPAETTSFVGRRRELTELRQKLAQARLISLVGPGGVGKTRLALRAAKDLNRAFRDGGWLVELADIRDPTLVTGAVISALDLRDQAGARPLDLLLNYLKDKELLIALDNCEHLLEAAAQLVSEILRGAPGVRVIATSREPLAVTGDHVMPVPPLQLPRADEPLAQVRENEAIMLFTERAAAASGSFKLDAANRDAVIDLCRRLDGLPLAIELAAVRTRVLGIDQIRDRLNDRFSLLTGSGHAALPRHQTLRTTIDWSHDLLTEAERILLRRLCVFAGRFTLEAAEHVCAFQGETAAPVLDRLGSLVEKSLVIKEDVAGVATYRLHETMREYAVLKLRDAGEEGLVEDRFIEYYRSTSLIALPDARYRLPEWLESVDREIDNVRAALGRCMSRHDAGRGLDLATAVGWYWITRATTEGVGWLDAMLALGPGNPEAQFWAYFLRGFLAVLKADPTSGPPALTRAIATARKLADPKFVSQALSMSANAANLAGDRDAALRFLVDAEVVTEELDDYPARIAVLQARVLHGFFGGDIDAVAAAASEGERLSREMGDAYSHEMMLLNLGGPALIMGAFDRAKAYFTEALKIARRIDDRVAEYALLDDLGCVAAAMGQARLAAQLIGAAETIRTQAGASLLPILAPLLAQAEAAAVASIGQSKFEAEVDAGRRMSRDEAIRLALDERLETPATASRDGEMALLGKREADVARLVADGLSNKEIGARLFISERTVDSHVRSIFNKLGFNSRSQIAAWLATASR
jgi:predicted ATPase/DNA-binding CsgD family transcriptional regulator